jgi:hypothetical protein
MSQNTLRKLWGCGIAADQYMISTFGYLWLSFCNQQKVHTVACSLIFIFNFEYKNWSNMIEALSVQLKSFFDNLIYPKWRCFSPGTIFKLGSSWTISSKWYSTDILHWKYFLNPAVEAQTCAFCFGSENRWLWLVQTNTNTFRVRWHCPSSYCCSQPILKVLSLLNLLIHLISLHLLSNSSSVQLGVLVPVLPQNCPAPEWGVWMRCIDLSCPSSASEWGVQIWCSQLTIVW